MPKIQILGDQLVSQIAAGEVVERPASVVKELVENALDAGAGAIRIDLEAGGKRRVRVVDDGGGMDSEDALLAFDRHATSKIASFDDLQGVGTLGFRGEALASIASVSRVTLTTATAPGEGHEVRIEGGRIRDVAPAAHPRGTSVDVRSLFFNVPARRKFLKAPRTELRRCTEVVQGYALAQPEISFGLRHEGRLLMEASPEAAGSDGAKRRISEVFGGSLSKHLQSLDYDDARGRRVWGFVGDPTTTKGRRYFTFVNRRLVRDRALMAVFYRSVREEWKGDEFPALFLFIDVPPDTVDVNVHPQKSEVRFRDSGLLDQVARALRSGLAQALGEREAPLGLPGERPTAPFVWGGGRDRYEATDSERGRQSWLGESPARVADVAYRPSEPKMVPLSGRSGIERPFRLLGQYKGSLILLEGPDGLYIIDQHVAHERILYERLRRALRAETVASQEFVEPLIIELGAAERLHLTEMMEELEACGFSLSELSGNSVALRSAPAKLKPQQAVELIQALASESQESSQETDALEDRLLDHLAASLSCRSAIKIHHPLTSEKLEALVAELFEAEQPYVCPHGRPTVLQMTDADLEKRFGRR